MPNSILKNENIGFAAEAARGTVAVAGAATAIWTDIGAVGIATIIFVVFQTIRLLLSAWWERQARLEARAAAKFAYEQAVRREAREERAVAAAEAREDARKANEERIQERIQERLDRMQTRPTPLEDLGGEAA